MTGAAVFDYLANPYAVASFLKTEFSMRTWPMLLFLIPALFTALPALGDPPDSPEQAEFQQAVKRLIDADWKSLGHFDGTAIQVDLASLKYRHDGLLEAWINFQYDEPHTLVNVTDHNQTLTMDQGLSLDIWDCKGLRSKRLGLITKMNGKLVKTFVMPGAYTEWEPFTEQPYDRALRNAICGPA